LTSKKLCFQQGDLTELQLESWEVNFKEDLKDLLEDKDSKYVSPIEVDGENAFNKLDKNSKALLLREPLEKPNYYCVEALAITYPGISYCISL